MFPGRNRYLIINAAKWRERDMSELTEQQIIDLAFERLPLRDAQVFVWHWYGRPGIDDQGRETISDKWTYSEISRFFANMSFRDISASLKRSHDIMLKAVEFQHEHGNVEILVSDDNDAALDFRIYLQMGSKSLPRVDITAKRAIVRIDTRERKGAAL
jgi:hypothetical protein